MTIQERLERKRQAMPDYYEDQEFMCGAWPHLMECVEALEAAKAYYDSTDICKHGCSPEVGHHEPECCIRNDADKALSNIEKFLGGGE